MYESVSRLTSISQAEHLLFGVPFLLKDLLANYQNEPTSYGSRLFAKEPVLEGGIIVSEFKRLGLTILDKINTPEFGLSCTTGSKYSGVCKNSWNLQRTSGGSSGGVAAAVAPRMVPIAHATDAGGSLRSPAACCSLFGLKPTREVMAAKLGAAPL